MVVHKIQIRDKGITVNGDDNIAVFVVFSFKIFPAFVAGREHKLKFVNGFTVFADKHRYSPSLSAIFFVARLTSFSAAIFPA